MLHKASSVIENKRGAKVTEKLLKKKDVSDSMLYSSAKSESRQQKGMLT